MLISRMILNKTTCKRNIIIAIKSFQILKIIMALHRIQIELENLTKEEDLSDFCSAGPVEDNMFHWEATLKGPIGTPYEGGSFKLDITFSNDYPFVAPNIKFKTKVYHPNIR